MYMYVYINIYLYLYLYLYMYTYIICKYTYTHTHIHMRQFATLCVVVRSGRTSGCVRYEQALVCLSNREIVDASRGRTFHCKMANNRFFY